MYDVVIVGGGPIGCKIGELLGKDFKVLIIDRKKEIGKPVHCTGLTSSRIFKLSGVSKDLVLNKIYRSFFYSPNETHFTLKPNKPFYVLDRELFDKELAEKAKENNVEIKMETEFKGFLRKEKNLIIKTSKKKFETKLLIGADGPNSTVAASVNLTQPNKLLVGIQETVKGSFDKNSCELWFGSKIVPGFFGWVVPINENWARIGVASLRKSGEYLENFIKKRVGLFAEKKDKVGGIIRTGLIKTSVSDNILLVGDAASQIKPFSGGGLIYGLIGSKLASEACKKALEEEKYDYLFLKKNYEEKWKGELKWSIIKGMILSNIVYNSPDWVLNYGFWFLKLSSGIIQSFLDPDFI